VRWIADLDGRDLLSVGRVTPLGLLVTSIQRTLVLDVDTGRVRCVLPKGTPVPADEVILLASGATMSVFDPWNGAALHRFGIRGNSPYAVPLFRDGRLLIELGYAEVVSYRFDDVRRPPAVEWRSRFVSSPHLSGFTRDLVIVSFDAGLAGKSPWAVGLRVTDGSELLRVKKIETSCAEGDLVLGHDQRDLIGLDEDGRPRWKVPGLHDPFAVTASHVLCIQSGQERLLVIDRATGVVTPLELPFTIDGWLHRSCAASDDVVVCANGDRLEGVDLAGRSLWSWRAPDGAKVGAPRLLPGRVYAQLGARQVVCLEEEP